MQNTRLWLSTNGSRSILDDDWTVTKYRIHTHTQNGKETHKYSYTEYYKYMYGRDIYKTMQS